VTGPAARPNPGLTAIVLAGGQAARFGADKLAADLGGVSVLSRALTTAATVAGHLVLAGPSGALDTAAPSAVGVRVVDDRTPFSGPLAALAGALDAVATDRALVMAGDMPLAEPAVLDRLVAALEEAAVEAAILGLPGAAPGGPLQPLPLAIRVAPARLAITDALAAGGSSLRALLDRLALRVLAPADWLPLDADARSLADVDTPDDLERLRPT